MPHLDDGVAVTQPLERAATIADVARLAGVATSTVSRALTQPGRVSPATSERVTQAARSLSYTPSAQARALTSGRTGTVAVIVPDIANPFYFDLVRGAQRQLRASGHAQVLVDTEESPEIEADTIDLMRKSSDGAIVVASRLSDSQLADAAMRLPLVTVNRDVETVPSVIIDSAAGAVQALTHLRSLGHRRICYVAGPDSSWSSARRWAALQESAQSSGVEVLQSGPWTPTNTAGAAAADDVTTNDATACIVFNDLLAIGMLQRFAERGVRVPEDISVVGTDDIFGSDFCHPPLTTVSAPIEEAGRVAVTMLMSRIDSHGRPRIRTILPTHLRIRSSSGPVRGAI